MSAYTPDLPIITTLTTYAHAMRKFNISVAVKLLNRDLKSPSASVIEYVLGILNEYIDTNTNQPRFTFNLKSNQWEYI